MKRIIVFVFIIILSGCGYSSYEECQLKESQQCKTSDCERLARNYCDAEFPKKLTYVESQDGFEFSFEEDEIELRIYPNGYRSKKKYYNICLTYKGNQKCGKHEPDYIMRMKFRSGKIGGGFYGPIDVDRYFRNTFGARASEDITVYLEEGRMLR